MKKKVFVTYAVRFLAIFMAAFLAVPAVSVSAGAHSSKNTGIAYGIHASGSYSNWDGVSNVSQFLDSDGRYCFAYDGKKSVKVVRTKNGKPIKKTISLKKKYPLFGGVASDSYGNYYLVCGKANKSNNQEKNTIFVSKYDKRGKLIKTVGDNGSSSLGYWYSSEFYTKNPFDAGCCDIAVNGDYLVVNYAREMYSGHQSNSVLAVNINKMEKVDIGNIYSSHSFAQRAIPYNDGFLFASEGDCYNRAFTVTAVTDMASGSNTTGDSFHFWVKKGTFDAWDMYTLNNNFAHMGGIAAVSQNTAALVGTSVKSLTESAESENEQLFIQIFDPTQRLGTESAYVTSGTRTGYSGPNGDKAVTDYGVKWLTNYSSKYRIANPQTASDSNGNIVVLYELYKSGAYKGVYYMVVDPVGNIITKKTRFSSAAYLNPCRMPVCANGIVYWTGNRANKNTMYVYQLKI